jgi:23S rRNA (guanosine2251-2'-O)-methyltransferase
MLTDNIAEKLRHDGIKLPFSPTIVSNAELSKILPAQALHQGIALSVEPLAEAEWEEILDAKRLLILDQISDPHNVGAILRSAAAFAIDALITTERNSASEGSIMAKAACGALDIVSIATVTNLAHTLDELKDNGFWCVGLDGEAKDSLHNFDPPEKIALVLGAEGKGLRRLTKERCDILLSIPMPGNMESLNVSNAAAITLYQLSLKQKK